MLSHLFGHDFFIAHSFSDASDYASSLAQELRVSAFASEVRTPTPIPIIDLEKSLTVSLSRSSFLILLISEAAIQKPKWLGWEVRTFLSRRGGNVIVVDLDGTFSSIEMTGTPFEVIADYVCVQEHGGRVIPAEPSSDIVQQIITTMSVWSRHKQRKRLLWWILGAGITLGIAVSSLSFWLINWSLG